MINNTFAEIFWNLTKEEPMTPIMMILVIPIFFIILYMIILIKHFLTNRFYYYIEDNKKTKKLKLINLGDIIEYNFINNTGLWKIKFSHFYKKNKEYIYSQLHPNSLVYYIHMNFLIIKRVLQCNIKIIEENYYFSFKIKKIKPIEKYLEELEQEYLKPKLDLYEPNKEKSKKCEYCGSLYEGINCPYCCKHNTIFLDINKLYPKNIDKIKNEIDSLEIKSGKDIFNEIKKIVDEVEFFNDD